MNSGKNRRRHKFFTCFRPDDIDECSLKRCRKDCSGGLVFISVQGEDKMVLPKILTSLSEEKSEVSSDGSKGGDWRRGEERSRRRFSRALKAVLFKTSLVKNLRSRKVRQDSSKTKSNTVSEKIKKGSNAVTVDPKPIKSSEADSSPPSSPISLSSVTASISISSSRAPSFRGKSFELKQAHKPTSGETARESYSSNIGLYLLLLCLLVLILWGRTCAIFCASTFLLLTQRGTKRLGHVSSPSNDVDLSVDIVDLEAHKKRIIMQGLLERNRKRVLPTC